MMEIIVNKYTYIEPPGGGGGLGGAYVRYQKSTLILIKTLTFSTK